MNGNMWDEEFNFLSRETPASDEDLACFFRRRISISAMMPLRDGTALALCRKRRNGRERAGIRLFSPKDMAEFY